MPESKYYLTEKLTVRFTKEEYDTLQQFSKQTGMSMSEVIRWATLGFFIITSESLINIIKPLKELTGNDYTTIYKKVMKNGKEKSGRGSRSVGNSNIK